MEKHVLEILLRKLAAGQLLPEEEIMLEEYINQLSAEELDQLFPQQEWENSANAWLQTSEEAIKTETAYEAVAAKLGLDTSKITVPLHEYRPWWRRSWLQAACVAGLIACGILLYMSWQGAKEKPVLQASNMVWKQIDTKSGEQLTVQLPDGSSLYVNGGSTVKYPEQFSGTQREIQLITGEVFLEVRRNEAMPFVVKTAGTEVKVLGTSFTVQNRPEDKQIEVAVKTGKVSFGIADDNSADAHVLLTPGKKGIFEKEKGDIRETVCNVSSIGGWRHDEFAFEDATLTQILNTLQYRYGLQYKLRQPVLRDKRFKATFRHRQPDEIIRVLSKLGDFKYYKKGFCHRYLLKQKVTLLTQGDPSLKSKEIEWINVLKNPF